VGLHPINSQHEVFRLLFPDGGSYPIFRDFCDSCLQSQIRNRHLMERVNPQHLRRGLEKSTKIFQLFVGTTRDSSRMSRAHKQKPPRTSEGTVNKGEGRIVCALCGQTITQADDGQPVIYSICATCKKLPHRNPGSAPSLN
jgi:hypothetical protein